MEGACQRSLQVIPTGKSNMEIHALSLRPSSSKRDDLDDEGRQDGFKSSPIKSSAVDLFSAVPSPAEFLQLQSNTDLNRQPGNWLSEPRQIQGFSQTRSISPFPSSFSMASAFVDCVCEVDVVSDAENIKKLLKIPYSKSAVSMMVHRIGNTLLIDEFDIHSHLLRTAENEWAWLKKFYLEHIFASLRPEGTEGKKSNRHSRTYLQQKNLNAKFLYHSLADEPCNGQPLSNQQVQPKTVKSTGNSSQEQRIPLDEAVPHFSKNIVWTFEDIRMLIGTDLPIFGGKTHPCLTLRLRDMNQPINVLTGIDYWLDNLMSNVPEVVMCYHLGGLVQKYELIKTEDLPRLPDSSFKPSVIRDVAQNILSFLKSKATKPGHTYWLLKGKGDDIVKLYDLSSLCSDLNEDPGQNPFTTPVAMLLFKVAKNLKASSDWRRHQATVLALLKNCLEILDTDKYPQVATAALYYLADVYLPASHECPLPSMDDDSVETKESWDFGFEEAELDEQPMADSSLDEFSRVSDEVASQIGAPPAPLGDLKQRALASLENVVKALVYITNRKEADEAPPSQTEEEPVFASPLRPIPMPYTATTKERVPQHDIPNSNAGVLISKDAVHQLKSQWWAPLLEKCAAALLTLAELATRSPEDQDDDPTGPLNPSNPLTRLKMAGIAWFHLNQRLPCRGSTDDAAAAAGLSLEHSRALGVAGDAYFFLFQKWRPHQRPEHRLEPLDRQLLQVLNCTDETFAELFPQPSTAKEALQLSLECYRSAQSVFQSAGGDIGGVDYVDLSRRLGNVCNELGVFHMNEAAAAIEDDQVDERRRGFVELFQSSQRHYEEGVATFKTVGDASNAALLSSNLGKLYRLQARALAPANMKEVSIAEWKCFNKALHCYKEALQILETRQRHVAIWDAVVWEYTSVLFQLATLLQDLAPLSVKSREEIEQEISNLLEKCIQLSRVDASNARQPLYLYRSATCFYRLASLLHDTYRNGNGESVINGKNVRTLAEQHYSSAASMFQQLENWSELLRIQLERAGLYEFQLRHLTGASSKTRALRSALACLLAAGPAVSGLSQSGGTVDAEDLKCMSYVCTRLHSTLLELAKLSKKSHGKRASPDGTGEVYRRMYLISLRCNAKESELTSQLGPVLLELSQVCEEALDKH